jgi:hypothetical protein
VVDGCERLRKCLKSFFGGAMIGREDSLAEIFPQQKTKTPPSN